MKVANLSQSHRAGVSLDDRPCWLLSNRGLDGYVNSFAATKPSARAEMGVGHGGFRWVCYIRATPIQRRCHVRSGVSIRFVFEIWSGARDLNPGPHGPEPS
jgi:hypothetical protein